MTEAARAPRTVTSFDLANIAVFAALTCVLALVPAIPVGPLGVPITLQTLAVFLTGMVLGGWRGFLALALYVVVGLLGVPVFAGFTGGPAVLAGPPQKPRGSRLCHRWILPWLTRRSHPDGTPDAPTLSSLDIQRADTRSPPAAQNVPDSRLRLPLRIGKVDVEK